VSRERNYETKYEEGKTTAKAIRTTEIAIRRLKIN
jgi:hypothetical protein